MPNWCDTNYTIFCSEETRKAICDAYYAVEKDNKINNKRYDKAYNELKEKGKDEHDIYIELSAKGLFRRFDVWLYHILLSLGYSKEFLEDYHENIRGYIYEFDDTEQDKLTVRCETAWSESEGFRHLLEDKFHDDESFDILYTAEEPGMDLYYTNDPDYNGVYVVDIECDSYGYETEKDTIKIVNDRLKLDCKTIEEALEAAEKHNDETEHDDHIWIHQFEYCND